MKSPYVYSFLITLFFACQNKQVSETSVATPEDTTVVALVETEQHEEDSIDIDVEDAQRWLQEVIENHFNEGGYPMEDICTPKYYEYKNDAIQVGYDGGLTDEEFAAKWSKEFNIKYAGISTGFLISGQDWGKIKVTQCIPKTAQNPGSIVFQVLITDTEYETQYKRDIKIIPVTKAYLIDDVIEYE